MKILFNKINKHKNLSYYKILDTSKDLSTLFILYYMFENILLWFCIYSLLILSFTWLPNNIIFNIQAKIWRYSLILLNHFRPLFQLNIKICWPSDSIWLHNSITSLLHLKQRDFTFKRRKRLNMYFSCLRFFLFTKDVSSFWFQRTLNCIISLIDLFSAELQM